MSRRHSIVANESNSLIYDIEHLSAVELNRLYGIEFFEDPDSKMGRVYDPVIQKDFESLQEWSLTQVEEETWSDLTNVPENVRGYDEGY
jgi:hypothetical protein